MFVLLNSFTSVFIEENIYQPRKKVLFCNKNLENKTRQPSICSTDTQMRITN